MTVDRDVRSGDGADVGGAAEGRPPRRRMGLGIVLVVLGLVLGAGGFGGGMAFMLAGAFSGEQFGAPGEVTVRADGARRYSVYHEVRGMYQGQAHSSASLPAGTTVEVTELGSGRAIPVSAGGGARLHSGSTERVSFAAFDAPAAGEYRVRVSGNDQPAVVRRA
jgi:hypothetical protein